MRIIKADDNNVFTFPKEDSDKEKVFIAEEDGNYLMVVEDIDIEKGRHQD